MSFLGRAVYEIDGYITRFYWKCVLGDRIRFGENVHLKKNTKITVARGAIIDIGSGVWFNNYCSLNARSKIEIGDDCIFGENVKLYDHNHVYRGVGVIKDLGFSASPIKIGKNCWFGSNVTILEGAEIGDNVVVGANTLINKKIPSDSVVTENSKLIIRTIEQSEKGRK